MKRLRSRLLGLAIYAPCVLSVYLLAGPVAGVISAASVYLILTDE